MPAHQSLARALDKTKSNGKLLTMIEWRAKGLAGALAKKAGPRDELIEKVEAMVQAADDTTVHQVGVLGLATHAANNFKVEVTTSKGTSKRDVFERIMVPKADGGVARTAKVPSVTAAPPSAADGASDSDLPGNSPGLVGLGVSSRGLSRMRSALRLEIGQLVNKRPLGTWSRRAPAAASIPSTRLVARDSKLCESDCLPRRL